MFVTQMCNRFCYKRVLEKNKFVNMGELIEYVDPQLAVERIGLRAAWWAATHPREVYNVVRNTIGGLGTFANQMYGTPDDINEYMYEERIPQTPTSEIPGVEDATTQTDPSHNLPPLNADRQHFYRFYQVLSKKVVGNETSEKNRICYSTIDDFRENIVVFPQRILSSDMKSATTKWDQRFYKAVDGFPYGCLDADMPAGYDGFFRVITQGVTSNQRVGRKIRVIGVKISGRVTLSRNNTPQGYGNIGEKLHFRYVVVLDRMYIPNTPPRMMEVFHSFGALPQVYQIDAQQDGSVQHQYLILRDMRFTLSFRHWKDGNATNDIGDTQVYEIAEKFLFDPPLEVTYGSTAGEYPIGTELFHLGHVDVSHDHDYATAWAALIDSDTHYSGTSEIYFTG